MLRTTPRGRRTESGLEAPPGVALTVTQAARACRVSPAASTGGSRTMFSPLCCAISHPASVMSGGTLCLPRWRSILLPGMILPAGMG